MRSLTVFEEQRPVEQTGKGEGMAVALENVSVHYRFVTDRPTSMKEFAVRLLRQEIEPQSVRALDDVSLDVKRGEVLGVIGRNGAGKSTLLKLIAGIIRPTAGRVRVWGRVTSLLGVGAGFSHELTGRENVYLYSALLGRSQDRTQALFEQIVDFAELGNFIDAPVRTYSSGMVARLGFAVAMAETPEILLVDEVLAVGDTAFQEKCGVRFREIQNAGATIVIVSHSMKTIRKQCERALWLSDGKAMSLESASQAVKSYHSFQRTQQAARISLRAGKPLAGEA